MTDAYLSIHTIFGRELLQMDARGKVASDRATTMLDQKVPAKKNDRILGTMRTAATTMLTDIRRGKSGNGVPRVLYMLCL